jgi:hypothetical protein
VTSTPPTAQSSEALKWHELLGIVGNITSITGISLLWFRDKWATSDLLLIVPMFAVVASFALGVVTLAYIALRSGFARWVRSRAASWKIVYFSIATPLALAVVIGLIAGVMWVVEWFVDAVVIWG